MQTQEAVKEVMRKVFKKVLGDDKPVKFSDKKDLVQFIKGYQETPYTKLSKLKLLEMGLQEYNSAYNRNATIEGLLEECHNLERQIETLERTHPRQDHTVVCYSQYRKMGRCANPEKPQPAD